MKTVTIHFTGGAPCKLTMPDDAVMALFEKLAAAAAGKTSITADDEPYRVINRDHITFVEVS